MLRTLLSHTSTAATCLLLAACAGTPGAESLATAGATPPATQGSTSREGYTLNEEELALDCKKLTGRMQVRILQIRDYDPNANTTGISRTMQSSAIVIFGGSTHGTNPDSRNEKDRAILEAYNRQLAAKGCRTFDLQAELKPKPATVTPTPVDKK